MRKHAVLFVLSGFLAEVVRAQAPPLGPEFQINTYTTSDQSRPSVSMNSSGSFVVVWQDAQQEGSGPGIFGQRFDSAGAPVGSEFQVNTTTTGLQERPSVAMFASGGFVVVWQSIVGEGPNRNIVAQRYDDAGNPLGTEFPVNTLSSRNQNGHVAADDEDNFVVVWQTDDDGDPGNSNVLGRRFDGSGSPVGSEFQVNSALYPSVLPTVVKSGTGDFVVAWFSRNGYYGYNYARAKRYNSSGVPTCEVAAGGYEAVGPGVALAPSDNFFMVWAATPTDIMAFAGCLYGPPFPVNTYTPQEGTSLSVGSDGSGNFTVTWASAQDGSGSGIAAQRFDSSGDPIGSEFQVNAFTTGTQRNPAIAVNGAGRAIFAWESFGQDGSFYGTFGRRPAAAVPADLSVDQNPAAGGGSNLNGLIEPGEIVRIDPTWQNIFSTELELTGTASSLDGPPGPIYEIVDPSADYGTIPAGGSRSCADATGDCFEVSIAGARPADHWDASLEETLSTGDTRTWTLHVGESFVDVAVTHPFYPAVENVFHNGVSAGCAPGNYCPNESVRRDQMAAFLLKAEHGSSYVPPSCTGVFLDVPCPSAFADWVEQLFAEGITGGCDAAHFCPEQVVTRAQMAVFLLKAEHGPDYTPPACNDLFPDVPCPSLFADWIERLYHESITAGCGGGNYCPSGSSTRGQMAVFLVKTFGLRVYGP